MIVTFPYSRHAHSVTLGENEAQKKKKKKKKEREKRREEKKEERETAKSLKKYSNAFSDV